MLTSQNTGKYLTKHWAQEREKCAQDKDRYTAADQEFYEISGQSSGMGDRKRLEETYTYTNMPIDPLTTPVKLDIRDRPEVGH